MAMQHLIDPKVDYPFKAIFGAVENRDVLIDFLNGVLQLAVPVVAVEILNPFSPAAFEDGRAGIVDVLATDSTGRLFQVEIQRQSRPGLIPRMLCAWADIYPSQLKRGADYKKLRPLISIWILDENLIPTLKGRPDQAHHVFELRDLPSGHRLTEHLVIHTVELRKWTRGTSPLDSGQGWLYFLRDGGSWDHLPPELNTPPMRKAMAVLERISENQEDYYRYLSRVNFERDQLTQENARIELEQALEVARAEKEQARAEKERSQTENERLRARLRALGIDPDAG